MTELEFWNSMKNSTLPLLLFEEKANVSNTAESMPNQPVKYLTLLLGMILLPMKKRPLLTTTISVRGSAIPAKEQVTSQDFVPRRVNVKKLQDVANRQSPMVRQTQTQDKTLQPMQVKRVILVKEVLPLLEMQLSSLQPQPLKT